MRYIIGIDEVGRGPVAGPVSVGIVLCKTLIVMPELTDSKKMTEATRERVSALAEKMSQEGEIVFGIFSAPARVVDTIGIEASLRFIIAKGLRKIASDASKVEVVLDGRLRAPKEYRQQTIIHGDELVPAISLAAVVAKVARDRFMIRMAKEHPGYAFEANKGYGTAEHMEAIRTLGPSSIHRMTYL